MKALPRPITLGAAFVALAMGLVGLLPLFGGPGYESALAAGLLVPAAAAITTALDVSSRRPAPIDALSRGAAIGAAFAAIAYATTLAHGLRAGFCDVASGSACFALGPGAGAVLGGAWGAVAGELAASRRRRRLVAVLAALAGPLAGVAVSIARFVTSPMIFAYDPFVGYFSGSLYDTVVDFSGLVTYRAGSAATLLAAAVFALHLGRDPGGRLRLQGFNVGPSSRPGLALLGVCAAVASCASIAEGDRLGHWQTPETIAAQLGARVQGERCDVVYPRGTRDTDIQRFVRECDADVVEGERWLGAPALHRGEPLRVRVYLFESAEQKSAFMGAARTQVAKPWRREVYVQEAGYPHPVLGHEIMHVLAGAFGRGPFKIAGRLGGLLPDPGLIEGVAVAGSPNESDLLPREWAKAMKDLGILPPLRTLFALGFLAENSSTAYTVSGAFVEHVRRAHGPQAVRAWYGGQALPEITGASWEEMERAWHAELDAIELPPAAAAQAKARFDRPAIFGRRCPRTVDACQKQADRLRARGDWEGALAEYRRILELDESPAARESAATVKLQMSVGTPHSRVPPMRASTDEGRRELEAMAADAAVPRHVRDRALEHLGDAALVAGDGPRAVALYREVQSRLVDEDKLRTLDVKIAVSGDPRARAAVVELLIGTRAGSPDKVRAAALLGAWAAEAPSDGLPSYLLARHYVGDGRYEEAAEQLDRALGAEIALDRGTRERGVPTHVERVRAEAERLRLVAACALGDHATAQRMFERFAGRDVPSARREAARDLLTRCGGSL